MPMSYEQEQKLREEIARLIEETEGKEDAKHYIDDVVTDVGCTREEALAELDRQT